MPATLDLSDTLSTLFEGLVTASKRFGPGKIILEDADRQKLSYRRLILASLVLGNRITQGSHPGDAIGVLLPNAAAFLITVFGINAFARVSAIFNFTAGERNIVSAARTARVTTVITSRRFIETAKLENIIEALENEPETAINIVYLEDLRAQLGPLDKVLGATRLLRPLGQQKRAKARPDSPAVILFTSGTEGAPKGVVLTNQNLVGNARQIYAHASKHFPPDDTMMNPLPMFHSFGLTAAALMPILSGMKTVLYPSPLHYREIPKLIAKTKATLLLATDTFLQGYARAAGPQDLQSIRFVVAGAERVKEKTRELWDKSGTQILEGYGATECSPVIACNLPGDNTHGTVGPTLPLIETRLVSVKGVNEGGRLLVRGPNVMAGYIHADNPSKIAPPQDGWHDTGDIVTIIDGRISIKGRAKRFAKIGGEMVSLAAIEALASDLWPEAQHVVVAIPDVKKGEQLVLVTEQPDAEKRVLQSHIKNAGLPDLWSPKAVMIVNAIPVLGSGKIDLAAAQTLVINARALL